MPTRPSSLTGTPVVGPQRETMPARRPPSFPGSANDGVFPGGGATGGVFPSAQRPQPMPQHPTTIPQHSTPLPFPQEQTPAPALSNQPQFGQFPAAGRAFPGLGAFSSFGGSPAAGMNPLFSFLFGGR